MSSDLYEVLGVAKDASAEVLRSAFRRKAMKCHPDRGGTAGDFVEINHAYRVLSDPDLRARYDTTGEIGEREPDNSEAAALGIIGNMLVSIIGSQNTGDPLLAMRQSLKQNIAQAENTIGELQRSVARCEKLSTRFKTKSTRDPIGGMIGSQIANMGTQIENHRQAIVTMERAQAILKDYEFEAEMSPMEVHSASMDQMRRLMSGQRAAFNSGWMGP